MNNRVIKNSDCGLVIDTKTDNIELILPKENEDRPITETEKVIVGVYMKMTTDQAWVDELVASVDALKPKNEKKSDLILPS